MQTKVKTVIAKKCGELLDSGYHCSEAMLMGLYPPQSRHEGALLRVSRSTHMRISSMGGLLTPLHRRKEVGRLMIRSVRRFLMAAGVEKIGDEK